MKEYLYTDALGRGALSIKSIEFLNWKCNGTPIGVVKMSMCASMIFSTYFCCVERPYGEEVYVDVIFHSPSE